MLLVDLDLTFCLFFLVCKLLCVLRSDSEDEEATTLAQWMSRFPISSLLLVTSYANKVLNPLAISHGFRSIICLGAVHFACLYAFHFNVDAIHAVV